MILIAEIAVWLAFVGAAWNTGVHFARWRLPGSVAPPLTSGIAIGVGALLVLAWGVLAGTLLRGDPSLALSVEGLSISASRAAAISALWGTARGGLFSLALLVALVGVAMSPARERSDALHSQQAPRTVSVLTALLLGLLAVSLLFLPPLAPAGAARSLVGPPLFLVDTMASLASLFAIGAIAAALVIAAVLVAGERTERSTLRATTIIGWLLATLLIGAEQLVRNRVGLTAQDPVVLGSSRAGLLLWLALSVLLHARVRRVLLPTGAEGARPRGRWPVHAAHTGALLVVVAFALHIVAARSELTLPPGATVEARDTFGRTWGFVNQGVSQFDADGRDITALAIAVTGPRGASRLLSTEQRQYFGRMGGPLGRPLGVRATWPTPLQEMRLVMDSVLAGERARVRVSFVPLALLWPAGVVLMVLGGAIRLAAQRGADTTPHAVLAQPEIAAERIPTS